MNKRDKPWPWRLLRGLLIWSLALVLLFEEWGWEPLARLLAAIGRLPGLRWIEARVRTLPPYGALGLFAVPVLTLLPIKILALYWLSHGHTVLGLGLIVLAKLGGTAITARLFMLTQPSLMKLAWFARWYAKWITFKTLVLVHVEASPAWHAMIHIKQAVVLQVKHVVAAVKALWQ
jgi:hypothetical protein